MTGGEFVDHGLAAIGRSRPWFEARMNALGIRVDPTSGLGQSLQELRRLEEKAAAGGSEVLPAAEVQRRYLLATGADFLSKALHWGHTANLTGFDDQWKLLKSGNPILTGPSDGVHSRHRAQTWELVLASLARTFCEDVTKAEPDVRCVWRQRQIGLAAKLLFTRSRQAFLEQVKKGIEQIQAQSELTGGCVVLNLVEMYPHAQEFEAFHRMRYKEPSTLVASTVGWVSDFLEEIGPTEPEWRRLFKGNSKLLTVAMFLPTVLTLWRGHATPMPAYRFHLFSAAEREDEAVQFTTDLQRAFEATLGFNSRSKVGSAGTSQGAAEPSNDRGLLRRY